MTKDGAEASMAINLTSEQKLRLECLRLAQQLASTSTFESIVDRARAYYEFIKVG